MTHSHARLRTLCVALCLGLASQAAAAADPVLVIHGGAGLERKDVTPQDEAAIRAALTLALEKGHAALAAGKPARDAVTAAITVLEDDPLFNAGKGAVFTHDGKNELDASIMDGATLRAGAVANVHHVKNPILLARAVMEHSPHVMLVGDGAEVFAKEQGIELVDPGYFRTERRWKQLQEALKEDAAGGQAMRDPEATTKHFGTIGAVALDAQGHLAAGTSTGGMTNKRFGRIGDSPVVGAGTYANDATCAISCTGHGEFFLRAVVAHDISCLMEYKGMSLEEACNEVIKTKLPKMGGEGGLIAVDAAGNSMFCFNSAGMFRGMRKSDGSEEIAFYS